jgi:hypothetical protein
MWQAKWLQWANSQLGGGERDMVAVILEGILLITWTEMKENYEQC